MQSAQATGEYPIAYFLCDALADLKKLKTVLNLGAPPKILKARVSGFTKSLLKNDTVALSPWSFGQRGKEGKVKGIVHFVKNAEEEKMLAEYIGEAFRVEETEMGVKQGRWFGGWEKVVGRVWVAREGRRAWNVEVGEEEEEEEEEEVEEAAGRVMRWLWEVEEGVEIWRGGVR